MANYPTGISLSNNFSVIVEITDDDAEDTIFSTGVIFGYIRQLGTAVNNCAKDNVIYFRKEGSFQFQQGAITFSFVDSRNILFVQAVIP